MSYPPWKDIRESIEDFRFHKPYPLIDSDTPTFMGVPHASSVEDLRGADAVIIGSPYVATSTNEYAGVDKKEWIEAPKRIRQQSIKYRSGYIQEFDLDLFEHLKVVDYGDADIPQAPPGELSADYILSAQKAVETKVNRSLDAGAIPIVIGQNSPCGSYAIAKPIAERSKGNVGVISIDTHWDIESIDELTNDPRIAGSGSWKAKMYEFHKNMLQKNLIEIGERGMHESKERVREFLRKGTHWYPMWKVRQIGIEGLCKEIHYAYEGTDAVYVHYDMDVIGGAGPAPGDILGLLSRNQSA